MFACLGDPLSVCEPPQSFPTLSVGVSERPVAILRQLRPPWLHAYSRSTSFTGPMSSPFRNRLVDTFILGKEGQRNIARWATASSYHRLVLVSVAAVIEAPTARLRQIARDGSA